MAKNYPPAGRQEAEHRTGATKEPQVLLSRNRTNHFNDAKVSS
ncbi:hypothetical protein [Daejeonella sp.]